MAKYYDRGVTEIRFVPFPNWDEIAAKAGPLPRSSHRVRLKRWLTKLKWRIHNRFFDCDQGDSW